MKTLTLFRAQIKARSRFNIALANKNRQEAERYSRLIDKLDLRILKRLRMREAVKVAAEEVAEGITQNLLNLEV